MMSAAVTAGRLLPIFLRELAVAAPAAVDLANFVPPFVRA
jgi:hypothetical protein